MKPSHIKPLLEAMFRARRPVLLTGEPGVGKSEIVEQAAKEVDAKLLISHPAVEDPTDAKGLPWPDKDNGHARFLPFGILHQALSATDLTIWFLDDFGQAPPAVQAAYMQLLLARRVGEHALPDCVTFVAATNRRTDRAGVSGILEPVKSRFHSIIPFEVDLQDWCMWAMNNGVQPEIIAYVRFRPEELCNFEPTADMTNCPLPRTWKNVSDIMKMNLPGGIQHEAISGAIGEGTAAGFTSFLRMYRELPSPDAILADPQGAPIPEEPSSLYAVSTAIATKCNEQTIGRIGEYVTRVYDAGHGEFAALTIRDMVRRDHSITSTQGFVNLASGPLGRLISGQDDD